MSVKLIPPTYIGGWSAVSPPSPTPSIHTLVVIAVKVKQPPPPTICEHAPGPYHLICSANGLGAEQDLCPARPPLVCKFFVSRKFTLTWTAQSVWTAQTYIRDSVTYCHSNSLTSVWQWFLLVHTSPLNKSPHKGTAENCNDWEKRDKFLSTCVLLVLHLQTL